MLLHQSIKDEIKQALKQKDQARLRTLRGLLSELTNELLHRDQKPQEELADETVLVVVKRLVKQRQDSIEQYNQAGREELAADEQTELEILSQYLPAQLSRAEIEKAARAKQQELNISQSNQAGRLIGALMKDLQGQADGAEVKKVVDQLLDDSGQN